MAETTATAAAALPALPQGFPAGEPIVHLESDGEGVLVLSMRDTEHSNVFRDAFVDAVVDATRAAVARADLKVLVYAGLQDVFAAGADKASLLGLAKGEWHVKDLILPETVLRVPVPTIAAMEGHAVGGGFVMALCCDLVLMAENARYGVNFMELGFTPGMGCTRLLPTLVGPYVANEMMFTGTRHKGSTFRERGLVNAILPADKVRARALSLARAIAEKPRTTLEYLKYSVSLGKRQALEEARVHEDFMHRLSFADPDVKQRIDSAYL